MPNKVDIILLYIWYLKYYLRLLIWRGVSQNKGSAEKRYRGYVGKYRIIKGHIGVVLGFRVQGSPKLGVACLKGSH